MLIMLKARGADIAAAGPGINRVVIGSDGGGIFVESHIAADQIASVRETVWKAARLRQQPQPRALHRPAGEGEDARFLLDRFAASVLVDRRADAALAVEDQLAD